MVFYIVASVLFGFIMGHLFSSARNSETNAKKEQKHSKTLSDKNAAIVKLKRDLRSAFRKIDTAKTAYNTQSKFLVKKEQELKELKEFIASKTEHKSTQRKFLKEII